MTVAELIAKLREYDPDMRVEIFPAENDGYGGFGYPAEMGEGIESVEIRYYQTGLALPKPVNNVVVGLSSR